MTKKSFSGLIFRAWITVDGERLYAKDYGIRGFPIHIGNRNRKTTFVFEGRRKRK